MLVGITCLKFSAYYCNKQQEKRLKQVNYVSTTELHKLFVATDDKYISFSIVVALIAGIAVPASNQFSSLLNRQEYTQFLFFIITFQ